MQRIRGKFRTLNPWWRFTIFAGFVVAALASLGIEGNRQLANQDSSLYSLAFVGLGAAALAAGLWTIVGGFQKHPKDGVQRRSIGLGIGVLAATLLSPVLLVPFGFLLGQAAGSPAKEVAAQAVVDAEQEVDAALLALTNAEDISEEESAEDSLRSSEQALVEATQVLDELKAEEEAEAIARAEEEAREKAEEEAEAAQKAKEKAAAEAEAKKKAEERAAQEKAEAEERAAQEEAEAQVEYLESLRKKPLRYAQHVCSEAYPATSRYFRISRDDSAFLSTGNSEDEDGLKVLGCVNFALGWSSALQGSVSSTSALAGTRTWSENGLDYQWTYHPDHGLNMSIRED